jgi:hypothetical protein
MTKFVTALTALTFALGAAAYAGTPSRTPSPASAPAKSPAPQPTSLTYSSTSTPFGAADPDVPGATGHTIVPGNNSTIAGDAEATQMERTSAFSN